MNFKSIPVINLSDYEDVFDYFPNFKTFATPCECIYMEDIKMESVSRVYDACIEEEDETGDTLYNLSFSFTNHSNANYYAYAHMRIDYGADIAAEFIRGTLFITKHPKLFFMTTLPSIEQTDDIYQFLLEDNINLCFDEEHLPPTARICNIHYATQIEI